MQFTRRPYNFAWLLSSPVLHAGLLFLLFIGLLYRSILKQTHGLFVYPLDDTYIHLALARTLAQQHVWGVHPAEFASASSSPGWTLLLASTNLLFGVHLLAPLILNVLCALGLLAAADYGIRAVSPGAPYWLRLGALLAILFCTPLPNLAMMGMEHVAQALAILLLAVFASGAVAVQADAPIARSLAAYLCISAFCAGILRYESVFLVAPVLLGLLLRRRFRLAGVFAVSAAIGPLLFGLYFHHYSGMWLPFSVVVKRAQEGIALAEVPHRLWATSNLVTGSRQLLFVATLLWLVLGRRSLWDRTRLLLALSVCVAMLHLCFAPVGWLMRYESYYFALLIFTIATGIASLLTQEFRAFDRIRTWQWAAVAVMIVAGLFLARNLYHRAVPGFRAPADSAVDRSYQQMQMARFVTEQYDHGTVMLNDIGMVAYYSHARLLDGLGLASARPAEALFHKQPFGTPEIAAWAATEHADVAIMQTDWTGVVSIPKNWIEIEVWRTPRNLWFVHRDMGIFAVSSSAVPQLCASLDRFTLIPEDQRTRLPGVCPVK